MRFHPVCLAAALAAALVVGPASAQSWIETNVLQASNGFGTDLFGSGVALDGDTLVVAAEGRSYLMGAAYVFERDLGGPGNWGEVRQLPTTGVVPFDSFGFSIDLAGDTIVAGAPYTNSGRGAAYVYERDQGGADNWGQVAKLLSPAASPPHPASVFGYSAAVDGDTIVLGGIGGYQTGAAWVFGRDVGGPGAWGLVAELRPSGGASGGDFGSAAALSGDTVAVGAPDEAPAGAVYVFERDAGGPGEWGETARLESAAAASDFGHSVELEGDTLVVGTGVNGSTHVFERGPDGWVEEQELDVPSALYKPVGGFAHAIDGDRIAAGAYTPFGIGAAYAFERTARGGDPWSVGAEVTACTERSDRYGESVGLSGDTIVVGATLGTNSSGVATGVVYVFERSSAPPPVRYCTAGTAANGCETIAVACGQASATAGDGFVLWAQDVPPATAGLFYYGSNGRQAVSWGNGTSYQCVVPPVRRTPVQQSRGTSGAQFCVDLREDLNARWCPTCPKPGHNPGAGATVQAQLWYRDPANTSNQTTGLSSAVEFTVGP